MPQTASLVFAFALAAPVVELLGQAKSTAQEHAEKAVQFVQQGDLKSAERELRIAVELAPRDPALLTSLGGVLGMEGDLQLANGYLAEAVKLNPRDPVLRRNLAANQFQLGRFKEAHENLDRLIRANPGDKTAIFLLGMVSENERNYTRAIALLESVPEAAEKQPEAWVALASSYYHTGRRENARTALRRLLSRPANPRVVFQGGRAAMDARDYPTAEALFATIQSTYSDPAAVDFQMALAQYRAGHAAESEKTLLETIQAKRARAEAYVLICKILADRGEQTRALQIATEGEQAIPDSYEVVSTKASLEMKLRYYSEAVASREKAVRLHESPEAKRDLALAEWRAGMRKQAVEEFEGTMRQFAGDARTYEVYGTLLLEEESPDTRPRAGELLKQAISLDGSSVEARYQLASLEITDGKPELALPYLQAAIKLDPRDSRLHYAMSRACRRLGRTADADKEMELYRKLKTAGQPEARSDSALGSRQD
jgi:tetratricopeptide (TPR) repeat protein